MHKNKRDRSSDHFCRLFLTFNHKLILVLKIDFYILLDLVPQTCPALDGDVSHLNLRLNFCLEIRKNRTCLDKFQELLRMNWFGLRLMIGFGGKGKLLVLLKLFKVYK